MSGYLPVPKPAQEPHPWHPPPLQVAADLEIGQGHAAKVPAPRLVGCHGETGHRFLQTDLKVNASIATSQRVGCHGETGDQFLWTDLKVTKCNMAASQKIVMTHGERQSTFCLL